MKNVSNFEIKAKKTRTENRGALKNGALAGPARIPVLACNGFCRYICMILIRFQQCILVKLYR